MHCYTNVRKHEIDLLLKWACCVSCEIIGGSAVWLWASSPNGLHSYISLLMPGVHVSVRLIATLSLWASCPADCLLFLTVVEFNYN